MILACLSCIEFYPIDKLPPRLLMEYQLIKVAADGRCFWSCMWLATTASKKQLWGWFNRQRTSQGVAFTKSEANMEKDNVVDWALRLTDPPPATRERVMKGESAIMEDLVPLSSIPTNRLFFFSNHCLGPMRGVV